MSLSSRAKGILMDNINVAFDSIGETFPKTQMPKCTANNAKEAWDYFMAKYLLARAEKRKEKAEQKAIKAGVLFDRDKNPRAPGQHGQVFNGEVIGVMLEVRNGAERVNVGDMIEHLISVGKVKESVVFAARDAATKKMKDAHVFTPYILTDI